MWFIASNNARKHNEGNVKVASKKFQERNLR